MWMPYDNKDDVDGRSHPPKSAFGVFQLCILVTMPQLTLHAAIATLILLILLQRTLSTILILRFFHGRFLLVNCSARKSQYANAWVGPSVEFAQLFAKFTEAVIPLDVSVHFFSAPVSE
jgi:hypothetical protein